MKCTTILEYLTQQGLRITGQRRKLVSLLEKMEAPFTAEQIYMSTKRIGIGRATVFRTLRILQEHGVLERVHLDDGCQYYQVEVNPQPGKHRDRIVCRRCGSIGYLDECPIKENVGIIVQRSGYRMEGHHMDLYGVCSKCDH